MPTQHTTVSTKQGHANPCKRKLQQSQAPAECAPEALATADGHVLLQKAPEDSGVARRATPRGQELPTKPTATALQEQNIWLAI
jgi:hypothetical protein